MSLWRAILDEMPDSRPRQKTWEGFATAVVAGIIAAPVVGLAKGVGALYTYSQQERDNTDYLEQRARELECFVDPTDVYKGLLQGWREKGDRPAAYPIMIAFGSYITEVCMVSPLPLPERPEYEDAISLARYRDALRLRIDQFAHENFLYAYVGALINSVMGFCETLPLASASTWEHVDDVASDRTIDGGFKVPVIDMIENLSKSIMELVLPFYADEVTDLRLFDELRAQLDRNMADASPNPDRPVLPTHSKLEGKELVYAYLRDTPFLELYAVEVPFTL